MEIFQDDDKIYKSMNNNIIGVENVNFDNNTYYKMIRNIPILTENEVYECSKIIKNYERLINLFKKIEIDGNIFEVIDFDIVFSTLRNCSSSEEIFKLVKRAVSAFGEDNFIYLYESSNLKNFISKDVSAVSSVIIPEDELKFQLQCIIKYRQAKKIFLEGNLRLVIFIAKRYCNNGLDFIDLIQEGNIGLLKALDKFDYSLGYKFSSYATWWIKYYINMAIYKYGRTITIPVKEYDIKKKSDIIIRQLLLELDRYPTDDEIALKLGIDVDSYRLSKYYFESTETISLDMPFNDDGMVLEDFINDSFELFDFVFKNELSLKVNEAINSLSSKEQKVIRMRYGISPYDKMHTLQEIKDEIGVSREGARHIENRVLKKLRDSKYKLEELR